jgi:hypothetical protein
MQTAAKAHIDAPSESDAVADDVRRPPMTPAQWNRLARQDPKYRRREAERQRRYYRRNREAIRYAAKCRAAGVSMTLAEAAAALRAASSFPTTTTTTTTSNTEIGDAS